MFGKGLARKFPLRIADRATFPPKFAIISSVVRILAISDEESTLAYSGVFQYLEPDLIVACGDLSFEYLEYVVTMVAKPLVWVPGNHDPDVRDRETAHLAPRFVAEPPGPQGCINIDGRVIDVAGIRVGGLGGSHRYRTGPNQYTQEQMGTRARRLSMRARVRRPRRGKRRLDVLVTHAPPLGLGDEDDLCHRGFAAYERLIETTAPSLHVHGHIHPHEGRCPDRTLNGTRIVNVVPYKLLELEP
jgi:predicted phosphodiesterase